jgi:hypothetical protein
MTKRQQMKQLDDGILQAAMSLQSLLIERAKLDQESTERLAKEICKTITSATEKVKSTEENSDGSKNY